MSSKTKSSLSDTSSHKTTPGTPRVAKLGAKGVTKSDADSPSPLQRPRHSLDPSPRSVTSKPSVLRQPSRISTPEKPQSRIFKPSELQAQLTAAQEELKKARDKLALAEKEKSQALNELKEVKRSADEANEKLQEALVAQKKAEENSEIEKFRSVELEQAGIEAAQKKEEDWREELDSVRNQHASDVSALLGATEELQRVKQELAMVTDTKNQALLHADDATKIAEIHAEKVEVLSAELARLKDLLESKVDGGADENKILSELKLELDTLKGELEKARGFEVALAEREKSYEQLASELSALKGELEKAKCYEEALVEKEKSYEQLALELNALKGELDRAKGFEEDLAEKEKTYEQLSSDLNTLKGELEKAKGFEHKLAANEECFEQVNSELKQQLEKNKDFEEKLLDKEAAFERVKSELESLKQELENAKEFEEKLAEKEESFEQVMSELDSLRRDLERAKCFEEKLAEKEGLYEKLSLELDSLKQELEKAKDFEKMLAEKDESYEQLNVELEAAKMAESYSHNLLEEWKKKAGELDHQVKEANRLERSASESLESVMKQLEGNSDMLHEAECEIALLKEKLSLMEVSLGRQKVDLEESERRLEKAKEETAEKAKAVEYLQSEIETLKEDKGQALENERLAACNVEDLLEEKNKLINELELSREEDEKSKKAMESLASALHEVSTEAREAKEKLLSSQAEHESLEAQVEDLKMVCKTTRDKYEAMLDESKHEVDHLTKAMDQAKLEFDTQMEDLKFVLKASNEKCESMLDEAKHELDHLTSQLKEAKAELQDAKVEWDKKEMQMMNNVKKSEDEKLDMKTACEKYEIMLDDAKHDIDHLKSITEETKVEYEKSKSEWERKELQLVNCIRRSEEEKCSMEKEIMRLVNLLRETEEKARVAKEEESHLGTSLREASSEAASLRETLEEAKAEGMKLRDRLLDKENELQSIIQENEQLRASEDANAKKVQELIKQLEEATAKKPIEENGELSESERDYDMLPKVVEFSEENGHRKDDKPRTEHTPPRQVEHLTEMEILATGTNNGLGEYTEDANGKHKKDESKEKVEDAAVQAEPKMWESCKIEDREFSMEREGADQESFDDDVDSKAEAGESFDQINGLTSESSRTSPSKDQQQKKKKPLYRKFGNLLKKGISNPK